MLPNPATLVSQQGRSCPPRLSLNQLSRFLTFSPGGSMSSPISRVYRFGEFRVDARIRSLKRGKELVPLTPKGFEVLLVLVQKNGGVVSKEELMMAVWPDRSEEHTSELQSRQY